MPKYPFLSEEWVDEARRIYGRALEATPVIAGGDFTARVNLIVTDAPFSARPVQAHLDTSAGRLQIDTGHLERPDVTVSMDYATARSLFVAGDGATLMQAFLGGRIRVDGDLSKLLDPRSGIWPGALSPAGLGGLPTTPAPAAPAAGPPGGAEHEASAESQATLGLDMARSAAIDVAKQLQDITE